MKNLKLILIVLAGVLLACNQAPNNEPYQITQVTIIDRSESMEPHLIPDIDRIMSHIKKDISFNEEVFYNTAVDFYTLPVSANLVDKPSIITLEAGQGEWNGVFQERQDLVNSVLNQVEEEITRITEIPAAGSTEFYSSLSYYLARLSKVEGQRKITVISDAIDNGIADLTKGFEDPKDMREIYPELIEHFSAFHDISKYDLSDIEVEIIHSFDGKYQSYSYETMLFFEHWLSSLNVDFVQRQTI